MYILGIESSCDDTCAAVVKDGRKLLSNCVASSAAEQNLYGGVVRRLQAAATSSISSGGAGRADEAGTALMKSAAWRSPFAPGLIGAVLVGLNFAKARAFCAKPPSPCTICADISQRCT